MYIIIYKVLYTYILQGICHRPHDPTGSGTFLGVGAGHPSCQLIISAIII